MFKYILLLKTKLKATMHDPKILQVQQILYLLIMTMTRSVRIIEKFYNGIKKLTGEKDLKTKNDNNGKQT